METGNPIGFGLFLGGDSTDGRFERLDPTTGAATTMAAFGAGHGCYAVAPEGADVLVGTHDGRVELFTVDGWHGPTAPKRTCLREGGAAVESASLAGDVAAVADADGVHGWTSGARGRWKFAMRWETGRQRFCALRIVNKRLWGLSSEGLLACWTLDRSRPELTVPVPSPPKKTALVHLVYLPPTQALVWPARGGLLALYEMDSGETVTVAAHEGSFYALFSDGDTLWTVGRHDGCAKRWPLGAGQPERVWDAPPDVTAGAFLPGDEDLVLLLDGAGAATAYRFEATSLAPVSTVASSTPYRAVAGLDPARLKAARGHLERARIEGWVRAIQQGRLPEGFACRDDVLEAITARGWGHVALELQADAIRANGGAVGSAWVEELDLRIRQAGYFDGRRGPSLAMIGCLRRLAELYEALLQWPRAWDCHRRLEALEAAVPEALAQVGRVREALAQDGIVAVPGERVSLDDLAAGSRVAGTPIAGLVSVARSQAIPCWGVALTPEIVWKEVETGEPQDRTVHAADVLWVEETTSCTHRTLCLFKPGGPPGIRLGVACAFPDGATELRVHAVAGVTACRGSADAGAEAMGELNDFVASPEAEAWVQRAFGTLVRAVGRAVNRKIKLEY